MGGMCLGMVNEVISHDMPIICRGIIALDDAEENAKSITGNIDKRTIGNISPFVRALTGFYGMMFRIVLVIVCWPQCLWHFQNLPDSFRCTVG